MKRKFLTRSILSAVVVSTLISANVLHGAGFQLTELSTRQQGNRNAGAAATADNAATVYFNPAGLTRLEGGQVEAGLHVIFPVFQFKDKNSTNAVGGKPVGDPNDDGGENAVVGNFYASYEINDRFTLGLGVNTPYGLVTEYNDDWIGRYNAIKSELLSVNINPSVGFRINEQFSLGAGFAAQYVDVELTNALDFGTPLFLAGAPVRPSSPAFDGFSKVDGNDWGFGFTLGGLYELSAGTRFGIGYRSKIDHTAKGNSRIRVPTAVAVLTGRQTSAKRGAKADVTIPATLNLGAYHEINERWAVMAGATWTDWSQFDELRIKFDDGSPDSVQPEDWNDAWRIGVGVNYNYTPRWTLRAGFEFDDSPVPSKKRTPRIPDEDRYLLALGVTYEYSDTFSFDLAYTHIFMPNYSIEDTEVTTSSTLARGAPVGSTLDGRYEGRGNIFSAQVQWNF